MSRALCFIAGALLGVLTALALEADAQRQWRPQWPTGVQTRMPDWMQAPPPVALHIRWVRAHGANSEVLEGICTLYLADHERGLEHAEDQVMHCHRAGARPVAQPPAGVVLLHWHPAPSAEDVARMYEQVYMGTAGANIVGFYRHQPGAGQPCHVVTDVRQFALGHEIKHCFDGAWHPVRGQGQPR